MLPLQDPKTGAPTAAAGVNGRLILSPPANAKLLTPSDTTTYDPPIEVWVGDNTAVTVAVVPYGNRGDASVSYPIAAGTGGKMLPVLCKQVKATGTTAATLIGHW